MTFCNILFQKNDIDENKLFYARSKIVNNNRNFQTITTLFEKNAIYNHDCIKSQQFKMFYVHDHFKQTTNQMNFVIERI